MPEIQMQASTEMMREIDALEKALSITSSGIVMKCFESMCEAADFYMYDNYWLISNLLGLGSYYPHRDERGIAVGDEENHVTLIVSEKEKQKVESLASKMNATSSVLLSACVTYVLIHHGGWMKEVAKEDGLESMWRLLTDSLSIDIRDYT